MAKLSKGDVTALAEAAGLEGPRVVMRKQLDGTVLFVVYHGPIGDRSEITLDRLADARAIDAHIARDKAKKAKPAK